jgi:nucleotide-binding universal stress UspA family protein
MSRPLQMEAVMLKDLLAIVDGSERSFATVDTAIELAGHHRAHLELSVLFEQVPLVAAVDPAGYGIALQACEESNLEELAVIRAKVAKAGMGIALSHACLDPVEFSDFARCAGQDLDMALIGPNASWNSSRHRRRVVEALILQAGTPTLLFPQAWQPSLFRHAVLGWNGSPEAAHAARSFVAILEPGASIDVVMVDETGTTDEDGAKPCEDIGSHLARHGFAVRLYTRSANGMSAAEVLQGFAATREAQLLAIGAYTHSRLREGLLGGATRELIDASSVPVLMVR